MKKAHVVRSALLFLSLVVMSGCILVPVDDGYQSGGSHGGGPREHQGERHDRSEGRR
jgi:hypothetical protein